MNILLAHGICGEAEYVLNEDLLLLSTVQVKPYLY
jgi:hypothetical protein